MKDLRHSSASQLLDLTRFLAAQAVVIGHAISFFGVAPWLQPPHAPYMQNVAVQVFFVLSGFLIAYTLNRTASFTEYAVDRFARIYSAYLPCLFVVSALLLIAGEDVSLRTFVGNLFMFQNWTFPLRGALKVPSLDGPLWTIAIEWHIYFFVGAVFFARKSTKLWGAAAVFAFVPIAFLFSDGRLGVGRGIFSLWLMGFAAFYLPHWRGSFVAAAAVFAVYLYLLTPGHEYQRSLYVLLAIAFYAFVARAMSIDSTNTAWGAAIRFAAAYSFTLYLVHYPLLRVWREVSWGWWGTLSGIAAANVLAIAIAWFTEMRHRELARSIKRRLAVATDGRASRSSR
ncbi:MAG TPA: acyltransferase [Burkholderiales bacterium]|nr:acyltransferase [Burkholderiales bacterium]